MYKYTLLGSGDVVAISLLIQYASSLTLLRHEIAIPQIYNIVDSLIKVCIPRNKSVECTIISQFLSILKD